MFRLITTIVLSASVLLLSCGSQKFQATTSEDKPLFSALNDLHKHPGNVKAEQDLRFLYEQSVKRHEETIAVYKRSSDDKRWDKIITELNALQHIYTSLQSVPEALRVVNPANYSAELRSVREAAADDFYQAGKEAMSGNSRESRLEAWELFKRANQYVAGYKDVSRLIDDAYAKSIVSVVINPIEEDNLFYNSWNTTSFRYRPEDYQESLVRELGGRNANRMPARFYTDRDARRQNINPDWIVDLQWRNIQVNTGVPQRFTRQVSKNIQVGTDTTGKAIYKTVYATLSVTQRTIMVQGDLDFNISDVVANKNINQGIVSDQISWTEEYATYRGDSRALDAGDLSMIRRRSFDRGPSREEVMNSLMRQLYPDLRYQLERAIT